MLGYGDFDSVMNVVAKAVANGPYLMGEQFTAADVVVGSTLRWGMMFNLLPKRQECVDYVARLEHVPPCNARQRRIRSSPRREPFGNRPISNSNMHPRRHGSLTE